MPADEVPNGRPKFYENDRDDVSQSTGSMQTGYASDDEDEELLCGYGSCTPGWLQKFHNAKWLLSMLGMASFIQGLVVNSIFPVGLSTIERQFEMTSTHTGIISSWYDFAILLAVFPCCHWGSTGHKGRWIGLGAFIMAIGSLICALPHYMISPHVVGNLENKTDTCSIEDIDHPLCDRNLDNSYSSYFNPYFLMFLLGQTFHGVGSTPLFSIGTAYIDENVSQKASPVYLAIHGVVTSVGPVVGLFIGGFLLTIYTDFDRVDVSKLPMKDSADPRWLGAWWLGFLGCAIAALINAFPIMMFAKELPEAKRHRKKDVNQVHAVSQQKDDGDFKPSDWRALLKAIYNILRNPTFVTCIVLGIFESIIINGFAAFMPKILEALLSTTPTIASYLSSVVIFAAATGVMLGGILIRKLDLQVGGMLKLIIICHVIALTLIASFAIQCPAREFAGITTGYEKSKLKGGVANLSSTCNADCHCHEIDWNPVCDDSSGITYYSPCFAGCKKKHIEATGDMWTDCGCLSTNRTVSLSSLIDDDPMMVRQGYCTRECGWPMWAFLVLLFFSVVASFATGIPSQQIMLRVVPFHQRTLAIGVHWTFLRLLGFIPGGILFGLMIDTTCLKWKESACGHKQSCWVHDPVHLSWTILAVAIVCKLVSILAAIIGYMTYRPTDMDSAMSIQTNDSKGAISLMVNDDRVVAQANGKKVSLQ
ncbi:unnamed protein product [Bursaphelenchus xylophilus]|uniref:Solute carrier organic anion transporter family member n=1 Tax=Bursaphelenchus xylophilus TaxID=6326 RepID=A0A1I7S025_BURXY|nr:unnamed protein product [Bursaphelenchus xylophilus]CAG9109066.1 unnamed protein product [Bursaphelenchus xylophilus]